MLYEQSPRFSAEEPNRLRILLAGWRLTQAEAVRWKRVLTGKRHRLPLLSVLLLFVFWLDVAALLQTDGLLWFERITAVCILLVILITVAVTVNLLFWLPRKAEEQRYMVYAADMAMQTQYSRIAFYGDRLTVTDLRGERTMYFHEIEACVETYDGFALTDGYGWLILRAQDLIPYDAQLIHDYLQERVDASLIQVRSRAHALLSQPLPITKPTQAECLATARMPYKTSSLYRGQQKRERRRLLAAVMPLLVGVGVVLATYLSWSPWFLLDLAVSCVGCVAVGTVFAMIIWQRSRTKPTQADLTVQFFADGIRLSVEKNAQFYYQACFRLMGAPGGVRLQLPGTQVLPISFEAIDKPETVKALAGIPINSENE